MDWVHCNNCFALYEPGTTLYLTSCGHMFCNKCLEKGIKYKENTCFVCRLPCSITKLVPEMTPDIQDFFTEPEEMIKKISGVLQFQKQHRRRLISYLLQSTKKFHRARDELKRMTELCQKQHKQLKEYQKIIKKMETQRVTLNKQASPFTVPMSPGYVSPRYIQSTATYKRPANSTPTPYSAYRSDLVTPNRLSKRSSCDQSIGALSQKSNSAHKLRPTVITPPSPESAGYFRREYNNESGYLTNSSHGTLINSEYKYGKKRSIKNPMKIMKM